MIVAPRIRGFICTTAHPEGCAAVVRRQAEAARSAPLSSGPRSVLILGSSMGYGLASRVAAAFGSGAATLGVLFERPAEGKRTATAGWYNTAAFHRLAREAGLRAESINGDAFSDPVKEAVVERIGGGVGTVDLVVYSLAAPRRPRRDGTMAKSVLKPIGVPYRDKTIDVERAEVSQVALEPASEEEVAETVEVMGGEDWELWIDALAAGGVLAPGATTVAYSYIGPELTYPIYRQGAIGRAKDHLEATARRLDQRLGASGGRALVSVNKAVVTQSSSAIPVVPLYITLLFAVMKEKGLHEGCGEQMRRLLGSQLYGGDKPAFDDAGRVRMDDLEMRPDVQAEVARRWREVDSDNVRSLADLDGYRRDFLELFGFGVEGVEYGTDVEVSIPLTGRE